MIWQLFINDIEIEIYDVEPSITLQANDIGNISGREGNSISFKAPRTAKNIISMQGLGILHDISSRPYTKLTPKVFCDGLPYIVKGIVKIKSTSNDLYNISIVNGYVEFGKLIDNKFIGTSLDLTEINHTKTVANIIASFTNNNYRYLIADYNGKSHITGTNIVNADYLVPSVSYKYLWDKIHSTFGFTFEGDFYNTQAFQNLWITYPKGNDIGIYNTIATFNKSEIAERITNPNWNYKNWNTATITLGSLINNWSYIIGENGNYKVSFQGLGLTEYYNLFVTYYLREIIPMILNIKVNNNIVYSGELLNQSIYIDLFLVLNLGDIIDFEIIYYRAGAAKWIYKLDLDVEIKKETITNISFSEELSKLSIKEFIRNTLVMFNLTPFVDNYNNHIRYLTLRERFEQTNYFDASDKLIEIKEEEYLYQDYAKANFIRYKYNDNEDNFNDGSFEIDNENLKESKTHFTSFAYSPEKELINFNTTGASFNSNIFKLWDKEIKDNNGVVEINYKGLSGRFYLLRSFNQNNQITIKSDNFNIQQVSNSFPRALFTNLKLGEIVAQNYQEQTLILNDLRILDVEIFMNYLDFVNFDISRLVYLKQAQNYYMINKINFKDSFAKMELIRVKYKDYTNFEPLNSVIIQSIENNVDFFTGLTLTFVTFTFTLTANDILNNFETQISNDNGLTWNSYFNGISSPLQVGVVNINSFTGNLVRVNMTFNTSIVIYSNIVTVP
jgi:hypothetical protein